MNQLEHLAIIMDGNGRWAKSQNKERSYGHKEGSKTAKAITIHASNLGIKYLTLYAFSTENWTRPEAEVKLLMELLGKFISNETAFLFEHNIRFKVIGDTSKFSFLLQNQIKKLENKTKNHTGLTQILALNYGAQDEILRAIKKIKNPKDVTKESFEALLDTSFAPSVDLLIRTGGEQRISNFLLWQIAYSEILFCDTYWPEFNEAKLDELIGKFGGIKRRFGGL